MTLHRLFLNAYATSFGAGVVAALCLPHAGITNFVVDLTPWNIPIFLASIGVLYSSQFRDKTPTDSSRAKGGRQAFLHAYLWAFGYFFMGLSWIGNALLINSNPYTWAWPLAILGLPALLALFLGFSFGFGHALLKPRATAPTPLIFATLFTFAEYARGHLFTGFSWNLPGMYWSNTLVVFQSLSIIGIYGLTFLTVWIAAGITDTIIFKRSSRLTSIIGICVSATILYVGVYHLNQPTPPTTITQHIVMVQANIPQSERFDPDLMADHFYRHLGLSERPTDLPDQPTLILWPETILPPSYIDAPPVKSAIHQLLATYPMGSALLTGAVTVAGTDRAPTYSNGLIAYQNNHATVDVYQKRHLVPFGEYIPYQKYIPLSPVARFENLTPGTGPTTVTIPGHVPFRPLICYESAFGGEVITRLDPARWIFVLTNDAWYGNSPGPYQHFAEARARAIETGLPVVRIAVTGVSGAFDAQGRIITTLSYGTAGQRYIAINIPQAPSNTFYKKFGDYPLLIMMILIMGAGVFISHPRFYRQSQP